MRLQKGHSKSGVDEVREFSKQILSIGDGKADGPNAGEYVIEIVDDIFINGGADPVSTIVRSTYPNVEDNLLEANVFQKRAILAPTNEIVKNNNDHVLSIISG